MAHTLTDILQTKVVPGLYRQLRVGLTSAWMEGNAVGVEYTGGKYVRMQKIEVDGLGNYDRALGYPRGYATGSKVEYELTMDRGREFLIDAMDNDETGFLLSAANIMSVFQSDHVIPEVDAYRYSKIYSIVATKARDNVISTTIDPAKATETLLDDIALIRDEIGDGVPLVVILPGTVQKYFGREFTNMMDYANFLRGEFRTKVKAVDGNPFFIVPSSRLKTEYDFLDGKSEDEEAGGFVAAETAGDIKWIITPANGPIAIGKVDKMRVFDPNTYQDAHAWKVDYRLFHDLWMTPNGYNNTIIRTGAIETPVEPDEPEEPEEPGEGGEGGEE